MQELEDREVNTSSKNYYNLPHGRATVTILGIHPDRDYNDNPVFRMYVHDVEYAQASPEDEDLYIPEDIVIDTSISLTDEEKPSVWSFAAQLILYRRQHGSIIGERMTIIVDKHRHQEYNDYYIKEVQEMLLNDDV